MAKKSTGVYIVDKFNNPYELSEYQLFIREECAKIKSNGIKIPKGDNILKYVNKLWQQKKTLK